MGTHLRAMEHHLPYEITQCYLPPDTGEHATPQPQQCRPVLDLSIMEGWRLSWPWWLLVHRRQSPIPL